MPSTPTLVITTLAEYQTRFWLPVARFLQTQGHEVLLLAFDDRSAEMLSAAAIPCKNVHRIGLAHLEQEISPAFQTRLELYAIKNPNLFLSHERVTFSIRETSQLARKFMVYSNGLEKVFDELAEAKKSCVLLQELGGFLSVVVSYFAARRRAIENWFIEPSFFRGRVMFVRNTFSALQTMEKAANGICPEVAEYLDQVVKKQTIVVPLKDRHHYESAFSKVLNVRNLKRLGIKLYDQHVLGKHQEFGHNLKHALKHALMAKNATEMRPHYRNISPGSRYIYFPLHVPGDMALTIRSPQFLDQIALVDYILRIMPIAHKLAVKEHPAQIGAIPAGALKRLLNRYDNLVILPPKVNNFDAMRHADVVVTVNSKSGAEALLLGRPVVVLGDAFYSNCPLVFRPNGLSDAAECLTQALSCAAVDHRTVAEYFQSAWASSYPGELYANAQEQIVTISTSIEQVVLGNSIG